MQKIQTVQKTTTRQKTQTVQKTTTMQKTQTVIMQKHKQ